MSDSINTEPKGSLDVIFDQMQERTRSQFENLRALDSKAGTIAGFTGIVLGVVASKMPSNSPSFYWRISIVTLLLSVLCAVLSAWIVSWRCDPMPSGMKLYLEKDEGRTKRQFLENQVQSFEENRLRMNRKVLLIRASMLFFLVGLILVSITVFF